MYSYMCHLLLTYPLSHQKLTMDRNDASFSGHAFYTTTQAINQPTNYNITNEVIEQTHTYRQIMQSQEQKTLDVQRLHYKSTPSQIYQTCHNKTISLLTSGHVLLNQNVIECHAYYRLILLLV